MKYIIVNACTVCKLENAKFQWKTYITFYLLKSVQNIYNSLLKINNFVPYGRPQSGTVIIQ